MSLAEKFQITIPAKSDGGEGWAAADSTRVHAGVTRPNGSFNKMPIGYDATSARDRFVHGFGGDTDVSDGLNAKSLKEGFNPVPMKAIDDQYGGEHIDLFYGCVEDENGREGFVERNNYLDRE